MQFDHQISDCDVREAERPQLEKFRERFSLWKEWLSEDEHSISRQIDEMLWNDMVFRMIKECHRLAHKNPSPNVGFNRTVVSFIDRGYAATQLLAIRRLTERNRRDDAITLPRLLDDMKANADLFTREIYVCHDGLAFDPRPAEERFFREMDADADKGKKPTVRGRTTTGPDAYGSTIRTQEHFDRLIRAVGKPWSRDDKVHSAIFDQVKSKLGICAEINKVASKFIAHAADAESRGQLNEKERNMTFDRIEACQRVICRVAAYIHDSLLYIGGSGLITTPQFNHLEHLEKGWLDPANVDAIAEYWDTRADKIETWTQGSWNKLLGLPG